MKFKPTVKRIKFGELAAVELRTAKLRIVALTAKGPRIAYWGRPEGDNLLLWAPGKYRRGLWELMGGHRLWISRPGADEAQETYAADNRPCTLEVSANGFTVSAPVDPVLLTQRGFTVTALADDRITVEHFVTNHSAMLWSGGLWAITSTLPSAGTTYTVPLGDDSDWDYATIVAVRKWGDNQGRKTFHDPQFELTDDSLRLIPGRVESKRMVKADAGIVAMHDPVQRLAFVKHAEYQPNAAYPLGTNLALYIGNNSFMAEMESMGPCVTLKPRQVLRHTETWLLSDAKAVPTAKSLRKLF